MPASKQVLANLASQLQALGYQLPTSGNPAAITPVAPAPTPSPLTPSSPTSAFAHFSYTIINNDTVEFPMGGQNGSYRYALVYPAKGVNADKSLIPNDNQVNIGRNPGFLPQSRAAGDASNYADFGSTDSRETYKLSQLRVSGKAGDGVYIEYIPA